MFLFFITLYNFRLELSCWLHFCGFFTFRFQMNSGTNWKQWSEKQRALEHATVENVAYTSILTVCVTFRNFLHMEIKKKSFVLLQNKYIFITQLLWWFLTSTQHNHQLLCAYDPKNWILASFWAEQFLIICQSWGKWQ